MYRPTLPEGQLLYAVGDIHGRLDLLEAILELIETDARTSGHVERRILVFLGDYVDRGPDSRGVVDRVIGALPQGFDTHFLKGNHEAILLNFLDDAWALDNWLLNGGGATMLSYGVDT
ncbi:MAG: metallophosphoesterase, partial [Methyloceanibacter sp.]